jgi:hypothetical protein
MTRFNAVCYFQKVAESLIEIGHTPEKPRFFRVRSLATLDELLVRLPAACFPAILVHDSIDGAIGDIATSDVYLDEPQLVFYVLHKVRQGKESDVDAAIQRSKAIGLKILSLMLRHKNRDMHGLQLLDFSRIPYQSVGPLADNCFGMMFMLSVIDHADLIFLADDWSTEW